MRHGEVDAQVKTGCVVDLRVPAAQEEGEDGQTEEEQAKNHANSVEPLQKRIRWGRLRRHGTPVFICIHKTQIILLKRLGATLWQPKV